MSKRAIVLAAVLMSLPTPGRSQQAQIPGGLSDSAQALYRRLEVLLPQVRAAEQAMRESDDLRRTKSMEPLDTLRVGPFEVVAPDKESAIAFKAFSAAFAPRKDSFEGIVEPKSTIFIEVGRAVPIYHFLQRGDRKHVVRILPSGRRVQQRTLSRILDETMTDFLPEHVTNWVSDGIRRTQERSLSYREFAVRDARVVTDCNAGVITGCIDALGLGDTIKAHWFTPAQLRAMVARNTEGWMHSWRTSECKKTGKTETCIAALQEFGGLKPPLTSSVRGDLFMYAINRGGRGAIARLKTGATPATALAAAGNSDINSLVRDWRGDLEHIVGKPRRNNASVGISTLFWTGVLLAFAMRSTRRRAR